MSNSIFTHQSYKNFVREHVDSRPNGGRGEWGKIARAIGVNATMVSQVFNGEKHLSLEQACELSDYLSLNHLEAEYFSLLVQLDRAGTQKLRKRLELRQEKLLQESTEVKSRLRAHKEISSADKAQFYSSWLYSACRILASIPAYQEPTEIAAYLGLPLARVQSIIAFLVEAGMCEQAEGKVKIGALRTHLDAKSLLVATHHRNWRQRAMERANDLTDAELMFSAPLSISRTSFPKIREQLLRCIQEVSAQVEQSDPEIACCFNIDWIELRRPQ